MRAVGEEVPVEVHVVFVGPAEPGHSKGIQDVNEDQRRFILEGRESIQKLKLDGRAGEALDAVNSGGMQKSVTGSGRSEPPDVDAERAARRTAGGQLQNMELAARFLNLCAKPGSRFLVVLGQVFRLTTSSSSDRFRN